LWGKYTSDATLVRLFRSHYVAHNRLHIAPFLTPPLPSTSPVDPLFLQSVCPDIPMETLVAHLIRGLTALSREAITEAFGETFEWDATAASSSGSGSDGGGGGGPPASPAGINSVTTPERTLPRPPGSGSSSNSSSNSSGGASKALRFGPDGRGGVDEGLGWGPVGNAPTSTSPMRTYAPRPRPPPLPPSTASEEGPPPPLPSPSPALALAASPDDVLGGGGGGGRRWSEQFFNAGLSLSARRPKAPPGSLSEPSPDTFKV